MSTNKQQLLALGFDEFAVDNALNSCEPRGDLDAAIELLLSTADSGEGSSNSDSNSSSSSRKVLVLDVSQYSFTDGSSTGVSSCTSISLEVLATFLSSLSSSNSINAVNNENSLTSCLFNGVAMHEIALAAARSSSYTSVAEHMGVEEIFTSLATTNHPICKSLKRMDVPACQGLLSPSVWRDTVFKLARDSARASSLNASYVGIIITKPPETVCVILPIDTPSTAAGAQCILFDSHPRGWCDSVSRDLRGAYTIKTTCDDDIIAHLNFIFPSTPGTAFTMMESMYNMYDCHFFIDQIEEITATLPSASTADSNEYMSMSGDYIVVDSNAPQDTAAPQKKQYYL